MSKTVKKFFAGLLAFVMVFAMTAVAAPAKEVRAAATGTETVAINAPVSYTGTAAPGYTFDSASLANGGLVGAMVFNITIDLPLEGDVAWNDWCGEVLAVNANGETKYYDFGGKSVTWGTDFNSDNTPETTGAGTESWVGSVTAARTLTVTVPVNAEEFTIDFYDNCWDSATDIPHYTIQSGTAVYGEIANMETVAVDQKVTYTGTAASGYTFDSAVLESEGTVAAAVFNISIDLPLEGDVAWNDWCGEAAKVTVDGNEKYYDFGGKSVTWGTDFNSDNTPETTGAGTDSWVGSAENLSISAVFPVEGEEFTVDFYDNCWDSALDLSHYTINSATVLYRPAMVVEAPEFVTINAPVSYTGLTAPGYTFDSAVLTREGKVGAMVFNITIDLPAEGDVAWNDWCGEALAVNANDTTKYYDFGGKSVTWGTDFNSDNTPETTGAGTDSWVGSVTTARTLTVTVPVNAEEFTIDFYDNCWDSATDIPHYTIQSAAALYGNISSSETVAIDQSVSYTGTGASAYTFDSAVLAEEGKTAYAVFNISIALPLEGDVAWNDWCGEAAKVTMGDEEKYFDFGGKSVTWGTDFNSDNTPETTGAGTESWAGNAENLSISAIFPIGADEYTIDFFDNCWDSATDIPHYTINSATVLYGTGSAVMEAAPEFEGTLYEGEVTAFLGTWANDFAYNWNNSSDDSADVTGTAVTAKTGDTVKLSLTFPSAVKADQVTPYLVFPAQADAEILDTYGAVFTVDKVTVDGKDVTDQLNIDKTLPVYWPESAGDHLNRDTIALAGGYNAYGDGNKNCLTDDVLAAFTTIEYTISLDAIFVEPKPEPKPTVDKDGVYNAYMGIQSAQYTFRDDWTNASTGLNGTDHPDAFFQMSYLDNGTLVKKAGTFKDVVIEGNGTYTVELTDLAWDDGSTALNLLFVSTDIPNTGEITFSNVKVDFDGKNVMEMAEAFLNPEAKDYAQIALINIWNSTLTGSYNMDGMLPNSTVTITFDVSGFNYDNPNATVAEPTPEPTVAPTEAPAEPTAAPTEAPVATEAPAEPTTAPTEAPADVDADAEGGMSPVVIVVIVVAVIAVAAGAAFVVMKKKK
ncbi:MAG: PT domain-containing protein [Lachnospiraceae bacterium]|nr:PT domain-containing protein [Lachnospiraceae bacterium]MBP3579269.1 PT domain-containing protein [Lachnospiraceae bacterium]